jgi:hypothetical protein
VLQAGAGTLFDEEIVDNLRKMIAPYPVGMPVLLSSGVVGIVVENFPDALKRPRVMLLSSTFHIDLREEQNIFVMDIPPENPRILLPLESYHRGAERLRWDVTEMTDAYKTCVIDDLSEIWAGVLECKPS